MRSRVAAWWPRAALPLVLGAYAALGLLYVLYPAPFTKPDEYFHFAYVRHLQEGRGLPAVTLAPLDPAARPLWELEAHQPPLYYALVWGAAALVPGVPRDLPLVYNPHFLATETGNFEPIAPVYPSLFAGGEFSLVHLGRLVALALGLLAVWAAGRAAAEFLSPGVAAGAAALLAFNPQFLFISTSFSNDVAAVAAANLTLWLLLRALRRGLSARAAVALGLALGVGLLTKLTVVGVAALVVVVGLALAWRARRARPLLLSLLALGVALVPSGWWFARNLALYGDPLALNVTPLLMGRRVAPYGADEVWRLLGYVYKSYWLALSRADFVYAEDVVYWALGVVTLAGLAGAVVAARRHPEPRAPLALLWLWFGLVALSFARLTAGTATIMGGGRLLFPAAPALAATLAVGLGPLAWKRAGRCVLTAAIVALAAWAVVAPFRYPYPALPRPVVARAEASGYPAVGARLGDELTLTGCRLEWQARPDGGGRLTLAYQWEVLGRPERDYSVFVQVARLEADGTVTKLAQADTYPGYGADVTSRWEAGTFVLDAVSVTLPSQPAEAYARPVLVITGLYDAATGERLAVTERGAAQDLYGTALVLAKLERGSDGLVRLAGLAE